MSAAKSRAVEAGDQSGDRIATRAPGGTGGGGEGATGGDGKDGLHAALHEVARPGGTRPLSGEQEAFLVALACSTPQRRRKWTKQLLADRLVTLGIVEAILDETVRRTLKRGHQTVAPQAVVHPDGER